MRTWPWQAGTIGNFLRRKSFIHRTDAVVMAASSLVDQLPVRANDAPPLSPIASTRSSPEVTLPFNLRRQRTLTLEQRHHGDLSWNYLPVLLSSDYFTLARDFETHILPLVRPGWKLDLLKYRVFEEGVTNKLVGFFQVGRADDESMVLVRVNGEGRELVLPDGKTEILVMLTLHRAGLSPPLYLVTENAMCYGYIPGRTLTDSEMQTEEVLEATAHALARFHSVPLPRALRASKPRVWSQVDNWMKLVAENFQYDFTSQRFRETIGSLEELRKEMDWLKAFLGAPTRKKVNVHVHVGELGLQLATDDRRQACDSVCVLCHNDAQPLNFVRTPGGEVVLIDMEYSGINYPAFDIGCFFCEFAGVHGTVDYSRYPSEATQKRWITHYLKEATRLEGLNTDTVTLALVHTLYKDANQFALVAHFMWTLWSLIQSKHSAIHFNYLEYGCARYTEYKKRKSLILTM